MRKYFLPEELLKDYVIYRNHDEILSENIELFINQVECDEYITKDFKIYDNNTQTTIEQAVDKDIWTLLVMLFGDYSDNPLEGYITDGTEFLTFIQSLEWNIIKGD